MGDNILTLQNLLPIPLSVNDFSYRARLLAQRLATLCLMPHAKDIGVTDVHLTNLVAAKIVLILWRIHLNI